MPVPAAPPPGATLQKPGRGREPKHVATGKHAQTTQPTEATKRVDEVKAEPTPRSTGTNDLLAFLTFVEHHKPGSSVNAIVENYSSHGAYVRIGEVKGYVPLSLMADPPPRSAREFMKIGESITLVVESFAPARRSIDLAIPTMATIKLPPGEPVVEPKPKAGAKKATGKKAAGKKPEAAPPAAVVEPEPAAAPKKRTSKKAAAAAVGEKEPKVRSKKADVEEPSPVIETPAQPAKKRASKKAPAATAEPVVEPKEAAKPTRRRAKSA
jgi:hypothetical protein